MKYFTLPVALLFLYVTSTFAEDPRGGSDANIIGHVVCGEEHLPFVNISIKGTTIGTTTDETGHYELINLPVGEYIVCATALGYKTEEFAIETKQSTTREIKFNLEEDILGLNELVVTGDRNARQRKDAMVIVNTLTPKLFGATESVNISEGLNFCPGLRTENNCSNCGFTQVRMNGLEGPYSQILINSRPIFSGLAGVYGLELIPSNMIEKIEVVRGGGSALYGSNAIAGTINLRLKDPLSNVYEIGTNTGVLGTGIEGSGNPATDYNLNVNASVVSDDRKTGLALYGFNRSRSAFDANGDSFSEVTEIDNTTFGARLFRRLGERNKLSFDFFRIDEERRGGDKFETRPHEATIAEALAHKITTGALSYEQFFREYDLLSVYASAQHVKRDSYYGAGQSLSDYGLTKDLTGNGGFQYKALLGASTLTFGSEYTFGELSDKKLGYPDLENALVTDEGDIQFIHMPDLLIANQRSTTLGAFVQYDIKWNLLKLSFGGRYDHYVIEDLKTDNAKDGNVFSPRINVMYDILPNLQTRLSFSRGYRAPQIFDEDLHIATSAARKVMHVNDPDLIAETSNSYMGSLDYNFKINTKPVTVLLEGFYTILNNPFANTPGAPGEDGTVIYTRINKQEGALVKGLNTEIRFYPASNFSASTGITFQDSKYEKAQDEFNERNFFRAPDVYGFVNLDWDFSQNWCLSASGNYTGEMLIPYYGPELSNPELGELRTSPDFMVVNAKLSYDFEIGGGAKLQLFSGVKNLFNAYQTDFDKGADRDPSYIYGPGAPRMLYLGIKIGNKI